MGPSGDVGRNGPGRGRLGHPRRAHEGEAGSPRPLSSRALAILHDVPRRSDGTGLVFRSLRGKPLSSVTLPRLTKDLGIAAVPHGFRSSFRDWAAERTNTPREVVEAALAHTVQNPTEVAYARSDLFERRRRLMDDWADYLCAGSRGFEGGRSLSSPDPNVHEAGLVTRDLFLV